VQIALPPSLKVTVPPPGLGLIVAVKVTELPYVLGVPEVATAVVVFWTALLKCAYSVPPPEPGKQICAAVAGVLLSAVDQ
jgi:hypothetical protein